MKTRWGRIPLYAAMTLAALALAGPPAAAGEGHGHGQEKAAGEQGHDGGQPAHDDGHEQATARGQGDRDAGGHAHAAGEMPPMEAAVSRLGAGHPSLNGDSLSDAVRCRERMLEAAALDPERRRRCSRLVSRYEGAGRGKVVYVRMVGDAASGEYRFAPEEVVIRPGDTVTWVYESGPAHNVMAEDIPQAAVGFRAPLLGQQGRTWSHTFFRSGTYRYHCHPHEALGMEGRVVVRAPEKVTRR